MSAECEPQLDANIRDVDQNLAKAVAEKSGKPHKLYNIHQNCIKFFDDVAIPRVNEMKTNIDQLRSLLLEE